MSKLPLFISVDALIDVYKSMPKGSFLEMLDQPNIRDFYTNFHSLIFDKAHLHLDDMEKFESSDNFYISRIKKLAGTSQKLDFDMFEHFYNIEYIDNFDTDTIQCCSNCIIDNDLQYYNHPLRNIGDQLNPQIYDTYHFDINPDSQKINSWSFLRPINLPSNSLIITDPYILTNPSEFDRNVSKLLNQLLPNKVAKDVAFHLSFVVAPADEKSIKKKERMDNIGKNSVSIAMLRDYDIKLNVYQASKDFSHDRFMLSNYWIATSGHSFDYFNNHGVKGNKNTTFSFYGIAAEGNRLYYNQRAKLKSILREDRVIFESDKFYNRLMIFKQ